MLASFQLGVIDQETPHKHGEVYFSTTSLLICLVRQAWLAWRTCFLLHAWLATRTRSITDLYIYKWGKDACHQAAGIETKSISSNARWRHGIACWRDERLIDQDISLMKMIDDKKICYRQIKKTVACMMQGQDVHTLDLVRVFIRQSRSFC